MNYLKPFRAFNESVQFDKLPKKEGAKTDSYEVYNDGELVGLVKWSSRMRGYGFLPTEDINTEIKEFVGALMKKRRSDAIKSSKITM